MASNLHRVFLKDFKRAWLMNAFQAEQRMHISKAGQLLQKIALNADVKTA
jgi:hypothetical protein